MSERKTAGPGVSEGARRATGEAPGPGAQKSRREFRMSAGRKQAAVLRLLQGEDLETLSRELRVTAAELSCERRMNAPQKWRVNFPQS